MHRLLMEIEPLSSSANRNQSEITYQSSCWCSGNLSVHDQPLQMGLQLCSTTNFPLHVQLEQPSKWTRTMAEWHRGKQQRLEHNVPISREPPINPIKRRGPSPWLCEQAQAQQAQHTSLQLQGACEQ